MKTNRISYQNKRVMIINPETTDRCDHLSRIYGNMFNALQEIILDNEKLKKLSPLDYSAISIYIGKFVEQEINSSVVQLMRYFRGIEMPDYYCKRDSRFDDDDAVVNTGRKKINLNGQKDQKNNTSLNTIPLGDAYYAFLQLKEEDSSGFFDEYPWLNNQVFLEAWRRLFRFRNDTAHIGLIISRDALEENIEFFQRFLSFMPNILELKKELAPDEFEEAPITIITKQQEEEKPYFETTENSKLPYAPPTIAKRYCELLKMISEDLGNFYDELNSLNQQYNFDAMIFEGPNGKKGLKDCLGNILVPANYDGFGFLPKPFLYQIESVIAVRNNKYLLVAMDGSGRELTKKQYDIIYLAIDMPYSPYIYKKEGLKSCGFLSFDGEEICDCIVDKYSWGLNSFWYESGDKYGYWQWRNIFLPPIYDSIKMMGDPWDPLIFTLDGIEGLVRHDGSFFPLSEWKKLDEDEQHDTAWDYLCEQYDNG